MKKVIKLIKLVIWFKIIKNWIKKKRIWRNEIIKSIRKLNYSIITLRKNKRSYGKELLIRRIKKIWIFNETLRSRSKKRRNR